MFFGVISVERVDEIGELADVAVDFRVEDLVEFVVLAFEEILICPFLGRLTLTFGTFE